jgi:beta-galactosidase GanA
MSMISEDYFRNPIIGAYVVISRDVSDEEKAIKEIDKILSSIKNAEASNVWIIVTDFNKQRKIFEFALEKAHSLGLKVVPVLQPYVSIIEHPEVKVVNYDGTTADDPRYLNIGCFNHPLLRQTARNLAEYFAKKYGNHQALYRISGLPLVSFVHEAYYRNDVPEFGGGPLKPCCYCEHCVRRFRETMKKRYGSIEAFNAKHGTSFKDWESLEPPRNPSNPSLWKEWLDFHSDIIPDYLREMIEYAKSVLPLLSTHELNDFYPCTYQCVYSGNDIWRMARVIDVGHEDMYPLEFDHRYVIYIYEYIKDLVRSAMGFDKLYTANGQCFYSWMGYKVPPTSMFEQVYSCLIHGSLGLVWWVDWSKLELWEQTTQPNREYRALVKELKDYERVEAEVALLYSWTSMELKLDDLYPMDSLLFYTALARSSIPVDIISEQQVEEGVLNKRRYKVLCAIGCPTLPQSVATEIRRFVEKGGVLIQDYGGDPIGEYSQVYPELVRKPMEKHDVYRIESSHPMLKDLNMKLVPVGVETLCEALNQEKVDETIATFEDGSLAAAISRRGSGVVVKAATMLGWDYTNYPGYYDYAIMFPFIIKRNENVRELVVRILKMAGVQSLVTSSNPAVEVGVWKRKDNRQLLLLAVNHLNELTETTVTLNKNGKAILSLKDFFSGESLDYTDTDETISFALHLDSFRGKAFIIELENNN